MTIKKFQGRTEGEAVARAKAELGENAVIMNVKEVKPKGIFQSFKKSSFEVTAATEEKEKHVDSGMALKNLQKMHETINVAADEPIQIPLPAQGNSAVPGVSAVPGTSGLDGSAEQNKVAEQSAIEFLKRNAGLLKKEDATERERIEEKLENLQSILEKQLASLFPYTTLFRSGRNRRKKNFPSPIPKKTKIWLL